MAAAALSMFVLMMLVSGALRTLIQRRRTGDSGNRRTLSPRGSLGWSALTATDIGYLMVGVGGPLAHWLGLPPVNVLQNPPAHVLGVVLAIAGIVGAFGAQMALGASWRIGVDQSERTALVISGPYRWVRNPIFTAVLVAFGGLVLMVPNIVALLGWALALTGIETQVRRIEEPHLPASTANPTTATPPGSVASCPDWDASAPPDVPPRRGGAGSDNFRMCCCDTAESG